MTISGVDNDLTRQCAANNLDFSPDALCESVPCDCQHIVLSDHCQYLKLSDYCQHLRFSDYCQLFLKS